MGPVTGTGAAGPAIPALALATLSLAVLILVLDHRRLNLGWRAALSFLLWAAVYGWVRSVAIRLLAEARLAGVPYSLNTPLMTIAGVPLQEILGWTAAIGLSGYFADRWLRRFGRFTDPFRTALVSGLVMAAVCLAVETAATSGGWWSWSLAVSPQSPIRFPAIALLDWGFVAIDFLLPFELWRRRCPGWQRWAGLALFPVHLAGHAFARPLPGALPFSGFDVVHLGLVAIVVGGAAAAHRSSPWPNRAVERNRFQPAAAVAVLLGTVAVQLLMAGEPGSLWTALPLAAIAFGPLPGRSEKPASSVPWSVARAGWLVIGCLVVSLAIRFPSAQRARDFEHLLRRGAASLAASRTDDALAALGSALALRPEHPEALTLLGWAELRAGRKAEARRHLEAALAARPGSEVATRLMQMLEQQPDQAATAAQDH